MAAAIIAGSFAINVASADRGHQFPPALRSYLDKMGQEMLQNPKVVSALQRGSMANDPCEAEWIALTLADAALYTAQANYDAAEADYTQCMNSRVPNVPGQQLQPIPSGIR